MKEMALFTKQIALSKIWNTTSALGTIWHLRDRARSRVQMRMF